EVQVMIGKKQVGETGWALAKNFDLGDLIGVEGRFGKTKTGELTIFADRLTCLAKSLEPHPDKHKGLVDVELRQRMRYLDLIRSDVQVMIGKKQVGETGWALAKNFDLGDLIGVEGRFGKTKTGELTIFADRLTCLAKSLEPHPDKHKGLVDVELRQRMRYLDLI